MNKIKRKLNNDAFSNEKIKILGITKENNSITHIEDFSNELFFEIFDYLEGWLLHNAFTNLNTRFQQLLKSSPVRYKTNLITCSEFNIEHYSKYFVIPHKHQIISFHFNNIVNRSSIFFWFPIDSTFNNLESLKLSGIQSNELISILIGLIHLPRLFSLTIHLEQHSVDLGTIYQLIFNLPKLKYNKLSSNVLLINISSLITIRSQISSIEYLVIDHACTINDLLTILSYTPQLIHLICKQALKSNVNNEQIKPIRLSYLMYLCIPFGYISFNEFEIFIKKISSKIQILKFYSNIDSSYLNAERWKHLIQEYIPNLNKFYFIYIDILNQGVEITPYHRQMNRFNSSFWLKKQWLFHLEIRTCVRHNTAVLYKISPRRLKSLDSNDYQQESFLSSIVYNPLSVLNISIENTKTLLNIIGPILLVSKVNIMNIQCHEILIGALIEFVRLLPNLDILIINCSAIIQLKPASIDEIETFRDVSNNNKITKVFLRRTTQFTQIQFLVRLCPYMKHFEIFCTNNIDPESIVRFVLLKNIKYLPNLNSMAILTSHSNEETLKKLDKIMYLEELQKICIIKKKDNRIYLKRNKP